MLPLFTQCCLRRPRMETEPFLTTLDMLIHFCGYEADKAKVRIFRELILEQVEKGNMFTDIAIKGITKSKPFFLGIIDNDFTNPTKRYTIFTEQEINLINTYPNGKVKNSMLHVFYSLKHYIYKPTSSKTTPLESFVACPAQQICDDTGISRTTVYSCIDILCDIGLVSKEKQFVSNKKEICKYRINDAAKITKEIL